MLEKFLSWSDPATRARITADDLLSTVTLYWVTGSIGSSARLYATRASVREPVVVPVPTSVLVPHEPKYEFGD